jgi:chromosome segregation ATPase
MSDRDLVQELRYHIKDLTDEKQALNNAIANKESRIKQLLVKLDQANTETKACAKKMLEAQEEASTLKQKLEKLQTIKEKVNQDDDIEYTNTEDPDLDQ